MSGGKVEGARLEGGGHSLRLGSSRGSGRSGGVGVGGKSVEFDTAPPAVFEFNTASTGAGRNRRLPLAEGLSLLCAMPIFL